MPSSTHTIESPLWSLALSGQPIDATSLAGAIAREASQPPEDLDFRTRLLIRDGLNALEAHWGKDKSNDWLAHTTSSALLNLILHEDLGEPGFPSLTHRIMETTKPETVLRFLRELGANCPQPTRLEIGGAIAAILTGLLSRRTEHIDIVDEIPKAIACPPFSPPLVLRGRVRVGVPLAVDARCDRPDEIPVLIRSQHEKLDELADRYGIRLTHFQSHFLSAGWNNRLRPLDRFGNIEVLLVDPIDLFIGKLFSSRTKDRDDLRAMARQLHKTNIQDRLRESASALLAEPKLKQFAADNWYIVYGQQLPA